MASALALGPDDQALLRERAQGLFGVDRHEQALTTLRGVFLLGPPRLEDLILASLCLDALGRPEEARAWSRQAEAWAAAAERYLTQGGATTP